MQRDDLEYVGFWPRVGASIIDTLLIMAVASPFLYAIYGAGYWLDQRLLRGPADLLISWVMPAIAVVAFWIYLQATPGKMALSARIVDANTGREANLQQLIIRYLGYFVAMIPFFVGIVWVAFDARKQGWHDKLAGTVVVRPKLRAPAPVRFQGAR